MVQKSKILGKPLLVFVTVGTTPFKFDRLFQAIDEVALSIDKPIKLIVQQGESDYQWRYQHVAIHKYLPPNKLINFIKKADKIITHGGPGSIFLIQKYTSVLPLIIARLKEFKEHIDNHQVCFLKFLKKKNSALANYIFIKNDLVSAVKEYLENKNYFKIHSKKFISGKNPYKISEKIENYIKRT